MMGGKVSINLDCMYWYLLGLFIKIGMKLSCDILRDFFIGIRLSGGCVTMSRFRDSKGVELGNQYNSIARCWCQSRNQNLVSRVTSF